MHISYYSSTIILYYYNIKKNISCTRCIVEFLRIRHTYTIKKRGFVLLPAIPMYTCNCVTEGLHEISDRLQFTFHPNYQFPCTQPIVLMLEQASPRQSGKKKSGANSVFAARLKRNHNKFAPVA